MSDTTLLPGSDRTTANPAIKTKKQYAVSVSHYTVVEFLESPYILTNPSTAYFSLSSAQIRHEFATSVFRQALSASPSHTSPYSDDPSSESTNWETDREAYCLTLGCALSFLDPEDLRRDISAGDADELVDLVLRYFNPSMPHFGRFKGIQRRIALDPLVSGVYYLGTLPSYFVDTPNGAGVKTEVDIAAKTLLCMLSMSRDRYKATLLDRCITKLLQYAAVQDQEELMSVRVEGFRTVRNWYHPVVVRNKTQSAEPLGEFSAGDWEEQEHGRTYAEVWFEGTVWEALE